MLLHIEVNSKAEFADICNEHGIKEQLAELEQRASSTSSMPVNDCPSSDQDPASTAEAQARVNAKQAELAYLQRELTNGNSAVDALRLTRQAKQDQVERVAAGYRKVEGSLKTIVAASEPANMMQQ